MNSFKSLAPSLRRPSGYVANAASGRGRSASSGLGLLDRKIAASRQIARVVSRVCAKRGLRVLLEGPSQVFIKDDGSIHLIVKTTAQAYQLRNMMPSIRREIEEAFPIQTDEIKVTVCPSLHEGLARPAPPAGKPRLANPRAAAEMREKAKRLPEGSRLRESLETLAESLED